MTDKTEIVMPQTFKMRSVAELLPYAQNARKHSADQVEQIVASMREFGFTNPVLVAGDDILAGHGRIMAANVLGLVKVPTIDLSHLTAVQRKAYILADNKIAENSTWDLDILKSELVDLALAEYDLSLTGFSDQELGELLMPDPNGEKDPDAVPPIPERPHSVPGDVWILGAHKIMCGDSCAPESWQVLMGSEKADCVWTDPPYNVDIGGKNESLDKADGGKRAKSGAINNDSMSDAQFKQFLIDCHKAVFAIMKAGAAIYVAHPDREAHNFSNAFREAGFKFSGCIIWRKNSMVLGRTDYQNMHEPILYGWKPGSAHKWYGGRKNTTVVDLGTDSPFQRQPDGSYTIMHGDKVLRVSADAVLSETPSSVIYHEKPSRSESHPTMKPVGLVERMLKHNARPGDIVVDAFSGSGTTLMAADRLGMCARVMELDPKFVDVCVKRWQDYTGRKAIHAVTGTTFPVEDK